MKLNKTSFSAKLYIETYYTYLPNNLCVYFWKLLVAYLLYPARYLRWLRAIYVFPILFINKETFLEITTNNYYNNDNNNKRLYPLIINYIILISTISIITHFIRFGTFFPVVDDQTDVYVFKIVLDVIYFFSFVIFLVIYSIYSIALFGSIFNYIQDIHKKDNDKLKKDNLFTLFFKYLKAKKNNVCPIIEWKGISKYDIEVAYFPYYNIVNEIVDEKGWVYLKKVPYKFEEHFIHWNNIEWNEDKTMFRPFTLKEKDI